MRIVDQIKEAVEYRPEHTRAGQHAFNTLFWLRPDLAETIRGDHLKLDPFYSDDNLPEFYRFVEDSE